MLLSSDNREGVSNVETQIADAAISQAMRALDSLDGHRHTLLSLVRPDNWCLMVGGGPTYFVATLGRDSDNLTFHNTSVDQTARIELCAGGQHADFAARNCTDREGAAQLIEGFFAGRERDFTWVDG